MALSVDWDLTEGLFSPNRDVFQEACSSGSDWLADLGCRHVALAADLCRRVNFVRLGTF